MSQTHVIVPPQASVFDYLLAVSKLEEFIKLTFIGSRNVIIEKMIPKNINTVGYIIANHIDFLGNLLM